MIQPNAMTKSKIKRNNSLPGLLFENDQQRVAFVNQSFINLFAIRESSDDLEGTSSDTLFEKCSQIIAVPEHFISIRQKLILEKKKVIREKITCFNGQIIEFDFIPVKRKEEHVGNLWHFKNSATKGKPNDTEEDEYNRSTIPNDNSDGFWDWDIKTNRVFCSEEWKHFLGYKDDNNECTDLTGQWQKRVHPEDKKKVISDIKAYLQKEKPIFENEHRLLCDNGKYRWIFTRGKAIDWDDSGAPKRMVGMLMDISEKKEWETSLYEALQKEKQLNELKSQFMSMALHEFRSPLSTILVTADSLEAYWEKMSKQNISKKIARIKSNVGFLTEVMEKVMNLSLVELGKIKFSPAVMDMNQVLTSFIYEKRELHSLSNPLDLTLPETSVFARIDRQMIKEVMDNLISNSIKYSPIDATIKIGLTISDAHIKIYVADQGIGIPEKDAESVFEPFHRGSNAVETKGTGLGLALSKKFVSLHGGEITFTSEPGNGTTFYILLPKMNAGPDSLKK